MPLQFKNSEGQVFLECLGGINYCLFLYCDIMQNITSNIIIYIQPKVIITSYDCLDPVINYIFDQHCRKGCSTVVIITRYL